MYVCMVRVDRRRRCVIYVGCGHCCSQFDSCQCRWCRCRHSQNVTVVKVKVWSQDWSLEVEQWWPSHVQEGLLF